MNNSLPYLVIFFLPAYLLRVVILGIPTNVFEILVVFLLSLQLLDKKRGKRFLAVAMQHREYMPPVIMIFLGLFVSMSMYGGYARGLGVIKGWFIIPIITFILLKSTVAPENRKYVFIALYWSSFVVAFTGIFYFFQGSLTYDGRLQAFFNSPNYLAMYLSPAVIIGVTFFEEHKKVYLLSLGVIAMALYLTFSYAAWIALLCALTVSVIAVRKSIFFKKIYVLVFIAMVVLVSQRGAGKMNDLLELKERSSLASRIMIWKSSVKIISDYWMWGVGPGNFQDTYLYYQKYFSPYLEWAVPHPHNVYMAFWLQSGIVGLAGFFWLLCVWVRRYLESETTIDPALRSIMAGIMVYALLHGMVDTTYFKNDLAVVFWLGII